PKSSSTCAPLQGTSTMRLSNITRLQRLASQSSGFARKLGTRRRQFLLLLRAHLWVCKVEVFDCFHDRRRDNKPGEPFVVGRHHVPWRVLGCCGGDRLLVCAHVVTPVLALSHVRSREFPVLLRVVEALHEALLLLLARHVQEEFEDDDALPGKVILEAHDVGEPFVPDALADELRRQFLILQNSFVHAHNQDFLVIGTIEYSNPPTLRQTPGIAPQEVVSEILL